MNVKKNLNRYREEELAEKEEKAGNTPEAEKAETVNNDKENAEATQAPEQPEVKVEEPQENKEQEELKRITNSYLRVLADFENFKKRTNEERIKERKYVYQSLFEKMINVIDIFDKAVNMPTDDEKLKNFLMGFKMINDNLKQILEAEGVKKIDALNQKFDPNFHHAMETEWDETKEENIILCELQTGYMYKDRLLRPSLVKVNQKSKGNDNNE